jgi:hypothetical protein
MQQSLPSLSIEIHMLIRDIDMVTFVFSGDGWAVLRIVVTRACRTYPMGSKTGWPTPSVLGCCVRNMQNGLLL